MPVQPSAKPYLWVIELHNGADSRLSADQIDHAITPALNAVEKHWRGRWRTGADDEKAGSLIIVGKRSQDKFFSNGCVDSWYEIEVQV